MKVGRIPYRVRNSSIYDYSTVIDSIEQLREFIFYKPLDVSTFRARHACFDEIGGF